MEIPAFGEVPYRAEVAELADALASGASGRKAIGVRVPASAPTLAHAGQRQVSFGWQAGGPAASVRDGRDTVGHGRGTPYTLGTCMARNTRPTAAKREREKALNERRKEKEARRRDAKERKATAPDAPDGEDPNIAGIKLGPQPLADWQVEDNENT